MISLQDWADIIADVWPDLTKEDLELWNSGGVTFKMRRRYQKFVLLYFVPRFVFCDNFQKCIFDSQPLLRSFFLGVILDTSRGRAIHQNTYTLTT